MAKFEINWLTKLGLIKVRCVKPDKHRPYWGLISILQSTGKSLTSTLHWLMYGFCKNQKFNLFFSETQNAEVTLNKMHREING